MTVEAPSVYSLVVFVHISAAIVAFGVVFASPILWRMADRRNRRSLPFLHRGGLTLERVLVTPGMAVVLVAGIYLVASGPHGFDEPWIGAALTILAILLVMSAGLLPPTHRKLVEVSERDVSAARGEVHLSDEYGRAVTWLLRAQAVFGTLVLTAVFLMVTKPGA